MTDEVEVRLRGALAARAGQITQERLRFGVPPTVAEVRRTPGWRRWFPVLIAATAAAVALGFALSPGSPGPAPEPVLPPAGPVATTPSWVIPVSPEPSSSPTVSSDPSVSSKPSASRAVPDPTAASPAAGAGRETAAGAGRETAAGAGRETAAGAGREAGAGAGPGTTTDVGPATAAPEVTPAG